MVINLLTVLYYNPGLDQDCPPWLYASWALGLFLYQTFDAVDGSQAYDIIGTTIAWKLTSSAGEERIKVDLWANYLIMVRDNQGGTRFVAG